jgi:hypothetical protein
MSRLPYRANRACDSKGAKLGGHADHPYPWAVHVDPVRHLAKVILRVSSSLMSGPSTLSRAK